MKRLSHVLFLLTWLSFTSVDALHAGIPANLLSDPALLAYWDFNDVGDPANAVDRVAGHVGALQGGAAYTADRGGRTRAAGDYGMDFGDTSDGQTVVVGNASFLNSGSNTVTYAFWQQLTEVASTSTFWAVSPSSSNGDRGAQAHVPWGNGTVFFDTAGCCGGGTQRISSMVPDHDYVARWSHYAFVKDGDNKSVWVNGVKAFEGTNTNALPTDFTELRIGSDGGGGNSLRGKVDDFVIFDRALTASEIRRLAIPEPGGFVLLTLSALALTGLRSKR